MRSIRKQPRRSTATLLTFLLVALASACGSTPTSSSNTPVKINVGVMPLAAVAPVYLGIDKGFFQREGLEVVPKQAQGGAALIPAVLSGDMQFAYGNNVSAIIANSKDLPIRVIANGNDESTQQKNANSTVVSNNDSDINKPSDLAGKTISVNTLDNVGEVTIKAALEKHEVDVSQIKFVELGFPDMLAALEQDNVDAAWLVTPFTEQAQDAGKKIILRPFYDTKPGLSIASYFTSKEFIDKDPKTVHKFADAINKSMAYAEDHPKELRAAVREFTDIPDDALNTMPLPEFSTNMPTNDLTMVANLMEKYDIINDVPSLDDLIWE